MGMTCLSCNKGSGCFTGRKPNGHNGFLLLRDSPKVMAVGALRHIRIYLPFLSGFRKSLPPPNFNSKDFELHFSRSLPTCTGQSSLTPPTSPPPIKKKKWSVEVRAVEDLLNYRFKNKRLIEEALTHYSYTDATNYKRLEFIGDAVLDLVVSKFIFLAYPDFGPGKLFLLRSANVSNEKLARATVRHRLYKYVRYNNTALINKVREYADDVQKEDETLIYGGTMKAPKILADIVESVAAAVFIDCDFNLKTLWVIFQPILEPIVMLDVEGEQLLEPVTRLFEACHKKGKQVNIKHWRKGEKDIFTVFVDGKCVASRSSEQEENAKLHAAEAALQKLGYAKTNEVNNAKQKLHELCGKKTWPKPTYRIVKEVGSERKFICSVTCELPEGIRCVEGDEKCKVKKAEHSAASKMLLGLKDSKYI